MTEPTDYRAHCLQLRAANEILKAEREEAEEREHSLKRQMDIMAGLQQDHSLAGPSLQAMHEEVDRLRQELIALLGEKQQLEIVNKTYQEKIEDLKYHNRQIKGFNEKLSQLHTRELDMLRREACMPDRVRELEENEKILTRQRELANSKLQEVANVAEEMEQYYMNEIRQMNEAARSREEDGGRARMSRQLEGMRIEGEMVARQQREAVDRINQQWERRLDQVQGRYQLEVEQLTRRISFLMNKIENDQEVTVSKPSLGAISSISDMMMQSKMVQSSSSVDSFRVTPSGTSTSFTMKENLTRRNRSGAKTPSKYNQTHRYPKHPLLDRNY